MTDKKLFTHFKLSEQFQQRLYWLLGAAILIHAIALFAMVFTAHQTHWGNYLFLVIGMPNAQAIFIEKITVSIFLIVTIVAVLRPRAYLLFPIFAYVFFEAYSGYYQGGYRFSDWTLATQALRYLTPLAFLVLVLPQTRFFTESRKLLASGWLLRIGLVLLFISHGLLAFWENPAFIDLILGSAWNLLGISIAESTAVQVLKVIGIVDIVLAIGLLIRPWKWILYWMAFWGLLTAFSRITALGSWAYFEILLRASHILAPLILLEINRRLQAVTYQARDEYPVKENLFQRSLWHVKKMVFN